jgi:hypothetical protein
MEKRSDYTSLRSSITEGAGGLERFRETGPQLAHCHDPQSYRFGLGERIGDDASMHVWCRQHRPRTVTFLRDGMARQLTPGGTSFSELLDKVAAVKKYFVQSIATLETRVLDLRGFQREVSL